MTKHGLPRATRLLATRVLTPALFAGAVTLAAACGDETSAPPVGLPEVSLDFEGSSLGDWSVRGTDTIQFSIRRDTNASTRYWFDFQVVGAAGRPLVFRVASGANMYGVGGWNGKQPVASADDGATWHRITDAGVDGGFFVFRYTPATDADRIALTLPYPFSRARKHLDRVDSDPFVVQRDVIGQSIDGNPVDWIEITDPAVPDSTKAHVWAVARQHPGEPEASYMVEGFIDWSLGSSETAARLRRNARVFVIPFLNPDGVLAGNQRVNRAGLDLNRQWTSPSPQTAPTIAAAQAKMFELSDSGQGPRIVLDFHGAPPTRSNFFIYNERAAVPDSLHSEMVALLGAAIDANPDFDVFERYPARTIGEGERTRSWAFRFLGIHGLTVEGSGVDTPYGPRNGEQMTEERYLALGATVAESVADVLFAAGSSP